MRTTGNTDLNIKISPFSTFFVLSYSGDKSLGNNLSGYPAEVTFNVKNVETFQYTRENDPLPKKLQLGFTDLPWPWVPNHNELVELYHFVSERWISLLIYNGLYNMDLLTLIDDTDYFPWRKFGYFLWDLLILSVKMSKVVRDTYYQTFAQNHQPWCPWVYENTTGPHCPLIWPVAQRFNIGNTWCNIGAHWSCMGTTKFILVESDPDVWWR